MTDLSKLIDTADLGHDPTGYDHLRTGKPRFEAEIMFLNPYEVMPAIEELNHAGFDVEVMDWVDDNDSEGTPYVWAIAMCGPGRDADEDAELRGKVESIAGGPDGGGVDNTGTADIPIKEAVAAQNAQYPIGLRYAELKREAAIVRKYAGIEHRIYPASVERKA